MKKKWLLARMSLAVSRILSYALYVLWQQVEAVCVVVKKKWLLVRMSLAAPLVVATPSLD